MRASSQKNSIKIVGAILICIFVLLFTILVVQFTNIINLKNKEKKLETAYKQTQEQIEQYDELIDYIDYNDGTYSQEFLENYAREVYGWGKNNRKYYTSN